MKKPLLFVLLLVPALAIAGAIKTFGNETLLASDLNTVLQHIHNDMRGGSHTAIVNADIDGNALIAHSKLATPALVPKAWAQVFSATPCDGSTTPTCTLVAESGIGTVTGKGTGEGSYAVTFDTARADGFYAVNVTSQTIGLFCFTQSHNTTGFDVYCRDDAGAAVDSNISIVVMDNL